MTEMVEDEVRARHYCDMSDIRPAVRYGETLLWIGRPSRFSEAELGEIRRLKPLILKEFAERAKRESGECVDGVEEIRRMRGQLAEYQRKFAAWCAGDGVTPPCPVKPFEDGKLEQVEAAHPLACVWLKADKMSNSADYGIASIGRRAKERIADGGSVEEVEVFVREENKRLVERRMWN